MIHYEIPKPKLSPNFTIEDIHKLRYWNYERLKDATLEERIADEKARTDPIERRLGITGPVHYPENACKALTSQP